MTIYIKKLQNVNALHKNLLASIAQWNHKNIYEATATSLRQVKLRLFVKDTRLSKVEKEIIVTSIVSRRGLSVLSNKYLECCTMLERGYNFESLFNWDILPLNVGQEAKCTKHRRMEKLSEHGLYLLKQKKNDSHSLSGGSELS